MYPNNLVSIIRKATDRTRAILGMLGFRRFEVFLVQLVSASPIAGDGNEITIATQIGNIDCSGNLQNPYVQEKVCQNVLASGGLYDRCTLEIGPFTKNYLASVGGGYLLSQIEPGPIYPQSCTGQIQIAQGTNIFSSQNLDSTKILIGQSITISDPINPGNNGMFTVTNVGVQTVFFANPSGIASSTVQAELGGSLSMHLEVFDMDNDTTTKAEINTIHEYELTHVIIETKEVSKDVS